VAASLRLKGLFALLLVLSIGMKIAVGNPSARGVVETTDATKGEVAAFLDRQGFRVGEDENPPEFQYVPAAMGNCRLLVVLAAPEGWHRDIIRQLASEHDQVFFVFRGAVYQDQPIWLTWMNHYWRMLNHYAGRGLPTQPVLGIIASPACDLRDTPWRELSSLPHSGLRSGMTANPL
jgi:hypothetical protein